MALIDCLECGHKVSDQADACPSCGRRLTDQISQLEGELDRSRLEAELARIDVKWDREVPKYMIKESRLLGGGLVIPDRGRAWMAIVLFPLIAAACGLFVAVKSESQHRLLVVGSSMAIGILLGLCSGLWFRKKTVVFERAQQRYLQRREAARAEYEAKGRTQGNEPSL